MTESKVSIEQGNILIADFMDIPKRIFKDTPTINYWLFSNSCKRAEQMEYHTSWNWLMSVVEKINKTKLKNNDFPADVIIYKSTCHINDDRQIIIETTATKEGGLIKCVWKAVVEFIKWYEGLEYKDTLD